MVGSHACAMNADGWARAEKMNADGRARGVTAPRIALSTLVLLVSVSGVGCGARGHVDTADASFEDARTTMRVRTALVNDEALGLERIIVDVRDGRVELSGRVSAPELATRAEELVRSVEGVRAVSVSLEVGPPAVAGRDRPGRLPSIPPPDAHEPSRILRVGVGGTFNLTPDGALGNGGGINPVIRLRSRTGWGPSLSMSWMRLPLKTTPSGAPALATMTVRPVMAGVEYAVSGDRLGASMSVVGGYSFNSLTLDTTQVAPGRAIGVNNAPALSAVASFWVNVTPRVGVSLFGGYLWVRPGATYASDTTLTEERLRADAVLLGVGVSYWLF